MTLQLYYDAECTRPAFALPVGEASVQSADFVFPVPGVEDGYYIPVMSGAATLLRLNHATFSGVPLGNVGDASTTYYGDGFSISNFEIFTDGHSIIGGIFVAGTNIQASGGYSADHTYAAVYLAYGGRTYIAIVAGSGEDASGVVPCGCFTVNCIGKKSLPDGYSDDQTLPTNNAEGIPLGGTGVKDRSGGGFGWSSFGGNLSPFGGASSALHLYVIDSVTYNHISGCLWGRNRTLFKSIWSNWLNYKFNPMAAVLSLHALPAAFVPMGDNAAAISIAGTVIDSGGGYCQAVTGSQFIDFPRDPESYALSVSGYIDYTDFTGVTITVYVPYCGKCTVPVSACMGGIGADGRYRDGKIWVQYRCDIISGNLCAGVFCRDRDGVMQLVETLTGNCAYQVPLSGNDNGASEILGALKSTAIGAMMGNFGAVASGAATLGLDTARRTTSIIGNHGGSVGAICNQYLYAEFTYTETSNPANYDTVRGRPSDVGGIVGDFSGYTTFDHVDLDGVPCTDAERAEIQTILQQGVYV